MDKSNLVGFTDTIDLDNKWLSEAANGDVSLLDDFIKRRQTGEPVAKIIGSKGFWTYKDIISRTIPSVIFNAIEKLITQFGISIIRIKISFPFDI